MLQVIVLASIATVVLMAVLFAAAAAVQESVERTAKPEPDWFISAPTRSSAIARQGASHQPTVNLNIMVPLCVSGNERNAPDVLAGRAVVSGAIRSSEGETSAVAPQRYSRPDAAVAGALPAADAEPRAALDITA
jgi:hypothetical protein